MVLRFVKFYKGADDKGYAVADDGLVFRFSVGAGFGFEHVEKLPDDAKEITVQEWSAAHLPVAVELHAAGEEAHAARELTPEEKAIDEKWQIDVREWRQARAEAVAASIQAAVENGAQAFEIEETTTKSYNSPVLLHALAAVVGAGQPPEDPIAWRRTDKIDRTAEMIKAVKDAVGPMIEFWAMSKAGGAGGRPAGRAAPQAAPPQSQPQPRPAPKPPAEPKAEDPTKP